MTLKITCRLLQVYHPLAVVTGSKPSMQVTYTYVSHALPGQIDDVVVHITWSSALCLWLIGLELAFTDWIHVHLKRCDHITRGCIPQDVASTNQL